MLDVTVAFSLPQMSDALLAPPGTATTAAEGEPSSFFQILDELTLQSFDTKSFSSVPQQVVPSDVSTVSSEQELNATEPPLTGESTIDQLQQPKLATLPPSLFPRPLADVIIQPASQAVPLTALPNTAEDDECIPAVSRESVLVANVPIPDDGENVESVDVLGADSPQAVPAATGFTEAVREVVRVLTPQSETASAPPSESRAAVNVPAQEHLLNSEKQPSVTISPSTGLMPPSHAAEIQPVAFAVELQRSSTLPVAIETPAPVTLAVEPAKTEVTLQSKPTPVVTKAGDRSETPQVDDVVAEELALPTSKDTQALAPRASQREVNAKASTEAKQQQLPVQELINEKDKDAPKRARAEGPREGDIPLLTHGPTPMKPESAVASEQAVREVPSANAQASIERFEQIEQLRFNSERQLSEAPLRSVRLNVGNDTQNVELLLTAKSNGVGITARTGDQQLGETLRQQLPQLSDSLTKHGYDVHTASKANEVTPPEALASTNSPSDSKTDDGRGSGGGSPNDRQRQKRRGQEQQAGSARKKGT